MVNIEESKIKEMYSELRDPFSQLFHVRDLPGGNIIFNGIKGRGQVKGNIS